jgi:diaminopimelate decarboxylase
MRLTDVVGPVCESSDCFASDVRLPDDLGEGDFVAIQTAGAYGFTMASQYNSRPRPPEILIPEGSDGRYRIVRERETYEDLIRGESP